MNDFINIFLKDIFLIIEKLFDKLLIERSFDKSKISVDYFSNSKRGDISTNLLIVLKKFLIDKNYNLRDKLYFEITNLDYVKNVEIAKPGFINVFFHEVFLIEKLNSVIKDKNYFG